MSDANASRWRYGDTRPIVAPIKTAVAFNISDCMFADSTDSYTAKPAGSFSWQSAVATPVAPTVADSGTAIGSDLTANATGVKVSYQFPWGEGPLSTAGSATPTAHAALKVTAIALPANALWINYYVETSAGSGTYKLAAVGYGTQMLIATYGNGQSPAASPVTTGALDVTQFLFTQSFLGCSAQYYDGTNLAYGIKDSLVRVDTAGVFDFDCTSASFNEGDLVGLDKATGNALDPQKVIAVAHQTLAIGRVVKQVSSATSVRVQLYGTKMQLARAASPSV